MNNSNKLVNIALLVACSGHIGWTLYQQGGWTMLVTAQVIHLLCIAAVAILLQVIQSSLFKQEFEPAFAFIILSLLAGLVLAISEYKFTLGVDLIRWQESTSSEIFSWLLSYLVYFSFAFAFIDSQRSTSKTTAPPAD